MFIRLKNISISYIKTLVLHRFICWLVCLIGLLVSGGLVKGQTWNRSSSGDVINDVYFLNTATGWSVGDAGIIYTTTNGGTTWSIQPPGILGNYTLNDLQGVWASDANNVWAVGYNGTILKYDGTSWSRQTSGTNRNLMSIWGSSATNIWAVGDGGLLLKYDGMRWAVQTSSTTQDLEDVWGLDANNVWAVGWNGTILKYNGSVWVAQNSGVKGYLLSVWGSAANNVWAVGFNGTILKYDGSSWVSQKSDLLQDLWEVWGSDANNVWLLGGGSIFRYDGTSKWISQTLPTDRGVKRGIHGVDAKNVWVTGALGTIFKFDGTIWSLQTPGIVAAQNGIWSSADGSVWVVGEDGYIRQYNGSSWVAQNTPILYSPDYYIPLKSIWGLDVNNIWAVGDRGTILRFVRGKWETERPPATNQDNLFSIWGSDATNIWAVGENGAIVAYDGTRWAKQTTVTSAYLYGIWGFDAKNAWAVGRNGTIIKYDGAKWIPQPSGVTSHLWGIWGSDINNIWAVGENGVVLRYNGISWTKEVRDYTLTYSTLYGIWGTNASNIWAVGGTAESNLVTYNGTAWTRQSIPSTRSIKAIRQAGNTIWAVGEVSTFLATTLGVTSTPNIALSITGITSLCSGSSTTLTASPTSGTAPYSYQWWQDGRPTGANSPALVITTAGKYSVNVTDSKGASGSASVDITQTTNLPVSITGANSFCTGQTTTLTANATDGVSPYTYQWKQNSVNVGTNATTYAASAAGSYSVAVTDSKGCTGTSAAYSVTQKPSPNVTVSSSRTPTLLMGESVVLSVPTAAGQTYQWAKDGVAIAGATNNSYTVSGAGSYTVTVTGSGCTATSSAVMVSIILANEPLAEEIGLRVSPNPAINQAKIVLQLAQSASANVYVLDASGRRVRTWESGGKATRHEVMLDMRSVAAGNYVVQAEAEGQVFTEKLVKQ